MKLDEGNVDFKECKNAARQDNTKVETKEEDLEEAESKGLNNQDIPENKSDKLKSLFGNFFVKSCVSFIKTPIIARCFHYLTLCLEYITK